jgi:TonB-linked SusC/RagA family outer membrane protein
VFAGEGVDRQHSRDHVRIVELLGKEMSALRTARTGFLRALLALLFVSFAPISALGAQATGRITGTVADSATGRALGSVLVTVSGTRQRAITDDAGAFTIGGVPAGAHSLEVRRIGYQRAIVAVEVTDGGTANVAIRVMAAPLSLEAIVTTGVVDPTSGTRVPFTVGRIDAENAPVPATNAIEMIQGKVAGVTVIPSGQAGSGTNIMLRSPTSIYKSNAPLIVVDGVIVSSSASGGNFASGASFGGTTADLESLNIESIEVVKGAAAASLYGSRAQAGVIQIRTQRGRGLADGATRVTARSEVGMNSLAGKIDWAKHHYYQTNANGEYINASGTVVPDTFRIARPVYERFQDVAYRDPIFDQVDRFYNPGQFYKNSVNVAQSAGRTNWFLSFVNSKEDGVVLNAGEYMQNDVRLNLDHQMRQNLQLGFSGYHSRSNRQELYGDTFFDLINQAPDADLLERDPDGTPFKYQPDHEGREENPLYVLATEENTRKRTRTQGNIEGRFSPLSWLSFDANMSYDRSDRRINFFLDQGLKTEGFTLGGPGEISQVVGTTDAVNSAISANFLGRRGVMTLRSTVRGIMEREHNHVTEANGEQLSAPGVRSLNNAQVTFIESTLDEIRSNGYFATLGADYAGKYIVDGLFRRDGSSLFGPEETWNSYYRVSGAYRMAEEGWWPFSMFSEFKLRASRGTAGGRPDFDDQFETFEFIEGGGVVKETLGNKFLKPEHSTETEIGIDAIVRDRYSVQLSYARNKVVDQLIQIPLAGFFGYTLQWQNAGTVEGNSVEATFEAQLMQRNDFSWRMGLVADRSRHRITEFNRSCFSRNTIQFICANETMGAMYGFSFIKSPAQLPADAQGSAAQFAVNDEGLLVWVGTGNTFTEGQTEQLWGTSATIGANNYGWGMPIKLRDAGGSDALVKIGDGNPDFRIGWSNTLGWKNWNLFGLIDMQRGGDVYNQTNQRMYQWARSADVDQTGKAQELKKPIEYYVALYSANDPTDYFVEDGTYLKLRELSLRYRLGNELLARLGRTGISGASISLIGRNLLTITDYKGYDPEVGLPGNPIVRLDSFDYPRYRTITGSFEITF